MKKKPLYKTWIEINTNAIKHNISVFRSLIPRKTKFYAVVKSNAYGHDLLLFSNLADVYGVDGFCVDSVIEGKKIRTAGIEKPILVLGPTLPHFFKEAEKYNITITISSGDILERLIKSKVKVQFHLKCDTGMHRQGFYLEDIPGVIKQIQSASWRTKFEIRNYLRGVYTHFAASKDILYPQYTEEQLKKFLSIKSFFEKNMFRNLMYHAAATGGVVTYPKSHFDMVRIGIGLYGYWPTREIEIQHEMLWRKKLQLKRVLSWKAIVSEIKILEKGDQVGYDLTEEVQEKTKAVIIPIGYWHGFPRSLSNVGQVLIGGKRAKVLGRVSMDLIVAGLPKNTHPKVFDEAIIIGEKKNEIINASHFGQMAETVHYEILTRINPLIRRISV